MSTSYAIDQKITRVEIMLQVIRVIEYCFVYVFIFSIIIILGLLRFPP